MSATETERPAPAPGVLLTPEVHHEITQWLYREARYADEHEYDAWEALWTDDARYWVPANRADADPETQISVVFDNRNRIATRIRQLKSGSRFSQTPQSTLSRAVSNVEVLERRGDGEGEEVDVAAVFTLVEWRIGRSRIHAGRTRHTLRRVEGEWRLAAKTVVLINLAEEIPTMAFLI